MNRWQLYLKIKNLLCHFGAIPDNEQDYNLLVDALLRTYDRPRGHSINKESKILCDNCRHIQDM